VLPEFSLPDSGEAGQNSTGAGIWSVPPNFDEIGLNLSQLLDSDKTVWNPVGQ
jgi:hypothetical protein